MDRTQWLLNFLLQEPLAQTHLLSTLEAELNSLDSIHTSYKPLILASTQLLKKEPSFNGVLVSKKHTRRSLLPFLGDVLSWLTGTASTKDVSNIKNKVNQLIATQHNQQENPVHVIFILNKTRYASQVNRQHINIVMNAAEKKHQDPELPADYCTPCSFHSSKPQVSAATNRILSPHVLPVEDLREMLLHIEETLPSTMHLPISCTSLLQTPMHPHLDCR